MLRNHKKEIFIALGIICVLFICTGFLAYFIRDNISKNLKDLDLKFETDDILELKNILPIADKFGKTFDGSGTVDGVQGFSEFSITNPNNKNVSYELILTKVPVSTKEISEDYIKLYLTNGKDVPFSAFDLNSVPSFKSIKVLADKPEAKLLYRGILKAHETNKYKLRMWIADNYSIGKEEEGFKCRVQVRIK